jgi:hypothetical protein
MKKEVRRNNFESTARYFSIRKILYGGETIEDNYFV